jgi:hypothetical protein
MYKSIELPLDVFEGLMDFVKVCIVPKQISRTVWDITILPSFLHNNITGYFFHHSSDSRCILIMADSESAQKINDLITNNENGSEIVIELVHRKKG